MAQNSDRLVVTIERQPNDRQPNDRQPNDRQPNDRQPNDRQLNDRQLNDRQPNDRQPNDWQPNDWQPNDWQPNDWQPNDRRPSDSQPNDGMLVFKCTLVKPSNNSERGPLLATMERHTWRLVRMHTQTSFREFHEHLERKLGRPVGSIEYKDPSYPSHSSDRFILRDEEDWVALKSRMAYPTWQTVELLCYPQDEAELMEAAQGCLGCALLVFFIWLFWW